MSFFTNLWADLVEKRLWPVAVALVVVLVGAPLALGGGSAEPVAALPPAGATGTTGPGKPELLVALDALAPVRANRLGRVHDPFSQPRGASAPGTAGASASPAVVAATPGSTIPSVPSDASGSTGSGSGAPAGATGSAPDAGPATPGPTPGPSPGPTPEPKLKAKPAPAPEPYLVTLRIGRAGRAAGETPKARDVKRLTPLPSAAAPSFVFLGVLSNQRTAVFMLSADVQATGEGTCRPRPSSCETLELHKGDAERLTVTRDDGTVAIYRLELVRIVKRSDASSPSAVAARRSAAKEVTRVSRTSAGGNALGSTAYLYDDASGLLRRVGSPATLGGHLPAPRGGTALRGAALQDPMPAEGLGVFPVYSPGL